VKDTRPSSMARKMLYKERAQLLEASKPLVLAESIFSTTSISRVPVLLSRKRLLILFTHSDDCPRKGLKQTCKNAELKRSCGDAVE
jgi:hypothetical protein